MKANELRIGNYIKWISTNDIEKVEDIQTKELNTSVINFVCITDAEPIPLTQEWLLKFGFKKNDDYYEIWKDNLCYSFEFGKGLCFGQGMEWSYDIELKHVHSLQNIYFSLTGEELTIKE